MGKGKRGHVEVDTYEQDDFVENDDGAARKTKKTKKSEQSGSIDPGKFWELSKGSKPRRVTISDFKNQKLVNLREFYDKDGQYLPSSKGLSLTIEQYKNLLNAIPKINSHLKGMGIDVSTNAVSDEESEKEEEEEKPKKRVKAKKEVKANIETTSDEDDE